jgi:hypothetical protein
MIHSGHLVPIRAWQVQTTIDLRSVKTTAGDYAAGELEEAVNNEKRNYEIVSAYEQYANGMQSVVFCAGVQESVKNRGLSGDLQAWVPALHNRSKLVVDNARTKLEDVVAAALGPPHLLFFDESTADDLIDGRLGERRRDQFFCPISFAVIGNEIPICADVADELSEFSAQLSRVLTGHCGCLRKFFAEFFGSLQGAIDLAMPDVPLHALQEIGKHGGPASHSAVVQTGDQVSHHRQTHGYMEPIQDVLGVRAGMSQ